MSPPRWGPRTVGWAAGLVAAAGAGVLIWWTFTGTPDLELKAWEVVPNLLLTVVLAVAWFVVPIALVANRIAAALPLGGRRQRVRTALRAGVARPVWQLLLALLLLTAGSTFVAVRVYLTAAARSWGDAFLWVSSAVLAVTSVQLLVLGVAGVVAGSRRSFHGGMVAGALALVAVTAGYVAAYLSERFAYRADTGSARPVGTWARPTSSSSSICSSPACCSRCPGPSWAPRSGRGAQSYPAAGATGGTGCF